MFVIIVYDVAVERVNKVCYFLRQYLNWVQNSVFEGDLTESQLAKVQHGVKEIIDNSVDSVRFYLLRDRALVKIDTLGITKADTGTII